MNTTMADGAAQRLVAQIGEALFGQPGLPLMELAEKVKGMRLASSHFDVEAMLAACVPGGSIVDPQVVADRIRHWFDAQPSPAGQGEARAEFEAWARWFAASVTRGDDGEYASNFTNSLWLAWQASLAARQPAGAAVKDCLTVGSGDAVAWMTRHEEPMLYPTFSEAAAYCDDDEPPIPLYAAPPAQAAGPYQRIPGLQGIGDAADYLARHPGDDYAQRRLCERIAEFREKHGVDQPAQAVDQGPGLDAAASLIQKKADDYADEFGYDDMGSLSFGRGHHAEVKSDHHFFMLELVNELRALIDNHAGSEPNSERNRFAEAPQDGSQGVCP